jgi:hypothetical protein
MDEAGAIGRQENDGFGDLVRVTRAVMPCSVICVSSSVALSRVISVSRPVEGLQDGFETKDSEGRRVP